MSDVQTFLAMVSTGEDPALAALARQVAALMADPRSQPAELRPVTMTRRQAEVTAVNGGPPVTADVLLDGVVIPGASPQRTYRPFVGDQVWLEFHGADAHISPPVTNWANFQWNDLTLAGAWVTFSVWGVPFQHHRDSAGWVHLRGAVALGAADSIIATMPVGYRPAVAQSGHSVTAFDTSVIREPGLVAIDGSNGNVTYQGPDAPFLVPLDGITYRVD